MPPKQQQNGDTISPNGQPDSHAPLGPATPPPPATIVTLTTNRPDTKKHRGRLTLLILLIIAVLIAAGAVLVFIKPSRSVTPPNKTHVAATLVKIPAGWKKVDTGLGFSVWAPAAWSTLGPSASPRLFVGDHRQDIYIGPNEDSEATPKLSDTEQSITVGTEKIDGITTEAAFNAKVLSVIKEGRSEAATQGADPNELTTTSKNLKINGRSWFEISFLGGSAGTLYYWQNDHAISLTMMTESASEFQQLSKSNLYPMAASLSVN